MIVSDDDNSIRPKEARLATDSDLLAIETIGLTKSFSGRDVVSDVSLRVPRNSVFGFLGPNGSGKTTTIRMLLGLVSPDSGEVSLLGSSADRRENLGRVGAVVEGPGFYPYLSGLDNLRRFAQVSISGQRKLNPNSQKLTDDDLVATLARVGLEEAKDKKFRAYSLGMKQRLAIASALSWPREVLVLDEPTNGLDPQGIVEVRELMSELKNQGMTIFVSSHILSEVEMVCSHIAIMRDGKLLFQGSTDDFKGTMEQRFTLRSKDVLLARSILINSGYSDESQIELAGEILSAKLNTNEIEKVVAALVTQGVGVRAIGLNTPSLEEAFVSLTGRSGHAR